MKQLYIERALFIVGDPDDGKSTQLRSIFKDWRFGLFGKIPSSKKIRETYWLSHDRGLYLRLTSPHEYNESPEEFFSKIKQKTQKGRWVVASPLQPDARNKMPALVESVGLFVAKFAPERVRVCFLSPNQNGETSPGRIRPLVNKLWAIDPGVECVVVDATTKMRNGLFYADFLDFS